MRDPLETTNAVCNSYLLMFKLIVAMPSLETNAISTWDHSFSMLLLRRPTFQHSSGLR